MKKGEKCPQFKAMNQEGKTFDSKDLIGIKKNSHFLLPERFYTWMHQ